MCTHPFIPLHFTHILIAENWLVFHLAKMEIKSWQRDKTKWHRDIRITIKYLKIYCGHFKVFLTLNIFFLKYSKLSNDVQIIEKVIPSRFVRHRQQVTCTYTFIYIEIHLLFIWTTSSSLTFTPGFCKTSFKGQLKKSLGNWKVLSPDEVITLQESE